MPPKRYSVVQIIMPPHSFLSFYKTFREFFIWGDISGVGKIWQVVMIPLFVSNGCYASVLILNRNHYIWKFHLNIYPMILENCILHNFANNPNLDLSIGNSQSNNKVISKSQYLLFVLYWTSYTNFEYINVWKNIILYLSNGTNKMK